mmetsp:Transcript_5936/g.12143  ORF Transcript_5936/g.12143 Transcript_5936/m.12143 type:complete len:550 (+) Transcript_5936:146-1795(+)
MDKDKVPAEVKPAPEFRIKLGAPFPDFECETTEGKFTFHDFLGREGSSPWTVLFSHPKDFTPVCTTELAICSSLVGKFAKMGVKLIGLSCDPVSEHTEWSKDVIAVKQHHTGVLESLLDKVEDALGLGEHELGFPLIADENREIATMLGMLDPNEKDGVGMPMPARALFLIGPDKTNRATILYPATTGRNFAEVLRVLESLFLTQDFKLATPGNWKPKDRVIVTPGVSNEEAQERFSNLEIKELPSGRPYLRYADCPSELTSRPAPELPPSSPVTCAQDFKIKIGATFPDFECKTTDGDFKFHEFLDREPSWTILFSRPKDFTPVCTTELGICDSMAAQFREQGVKLLGLSCDSVSEHAAWSRDILAAKQEDRGKLAFPLIADENREIAARLGMLDPNERDASGIPMPARALFFIAPDKTNRATILYPATTGRNFDEVLRVVLSLHLTQDHKLATPGNWEKGARVIVTPAVTEEEAREKFASLEIKDLPSKKPYLRFVDCPGTEPSAVTPLAKPGSPSTAKPDAAPEQPTADDKVSVTEVIPHRTICCL